MTTRARLHTLAADLRTAAPAAAALPDVSGVARREANPARGQRGDFQKVTITLPLDMLRELRLLGLTRRGQGAKSTGISELVREAIQDFLECAHGTPTSTG
jgi:hypothetical protein